MPSGTATAESRSPGLAVKVLYGAGEIPNAVKTVAFGLFTLYYYTTVLGLSGTLVGIASGIGLIWDALIDPYVGHASDGLHSRYGRRHPFMLVGSLTMGAAFWLFFNPPAGLSSVALFFWLVILGLVVRTASSIYAIPYFALGAELSHDYRERTTITAIRGFLALVGTLGAASLSFLVFFPDQGAGIDPKLNASAYPLMGAAFGALMTVLGLAATLGTRQWRGPTTPEPAVQVDRGFIDNFRQSLSNRSFRALFVSCSLFFLAVVINGSLTIHYVTYYLEITSSAALSAFQAAFYIGALLGVLVWLRVSTRLEKQRLCFVSLAGVTLIMIAAVLLVGEGHLLGTANVRAALAGHALAGFFGAVFWFMPGSMIADIADEDQLQSGRRREASFFGAFYFGQQIAAGASVLLTGVLLDWYAGLVPGRLEQSGETVNRIGMLYGLVPAALMIAAAVSLSRYTLTKARVAAVQASLMTHAPSRSAAVAAPDQPFTLDVNQVL